MKYKVVKFSELIIATNCFLALNFKFIESQLFSFMILKFNNYNYQETATTALICFWFGIVAVVEFVTSIVKVFNIINGVYIFFIAYLCKH